MKLTAMMVLRNEADRYLRLNLDHLLTFCDEVRILDDASDDAFAEIGWYDDERVIVKRQSASTFYAHEGRTRQELLRWCEEGNPTHVLAIDADEFVADGDALRRIIADGKARTGVWKLTMTEIWGADEDGLLVRMDGKWPPRPVGIAYEVSPQRYTDRQMRRHWRMPDAALACGRVPTAVQMRANRTLEKPVTEILHFGWACAADRAERYKRYEVHDGGKHHDGGHLRSIMFSDAQVQTKRVPWPAALDKDALLERVNRGRS